MNRAILDTLASLAREMSAQGRTTEEQALTEAVVGLGQLAGGLITAGQAAERLSVSIPTVRWWLERGALEGVDLGTHWLVFEASVERILRIRRNLKEMDEEGNPTDEELLELERDSRGVARKEHVA